MTIKQVKQQTIKRASFHQLYGNKKQPKLRFTGANVTNQTTLSSRSEPQTCFTFDKLQHEAIPQNCYDPSVKPPPWTPTQSRSHQIAISSPVRES